jgi:hypothetical protein
LSFEGVLGFHELVELAELGNDCVDALQAHDDTTGSLEARNAAELKLKEIYLI